MKLLNWLSVTIIPLLAVSLTAGSSSAETDLAASVREKAVAAAAKLQSACGQDLKSYCSTVTPDEGRLILCMEAHDDKLSSQCLVELHEAATMVHTAVDLMKEVTLACKEDISRVCAGVRPGQGRIAQCLTSKEANVSKSCTDAIENLRAAAK